MKISILGCGTFGSAIKTHLLKKGHTVIAEEIGNSEIIFVSVPSYAVLPVLIKVKNEIKDQKIIICSKGFDESGKLLSEVLEKEFPNNEILFLYGPTLASEIKNGDFSAMVLAGKGDLSAQAGVKEELKKEIESESLYIELSDDIVGVQVGSALKNTITIFNGIIEGAGYGENTKAFVFTKGIQEIQKFGVALGAKPSTFMGLTCLGDLTLNSRNKNLGIELGKGRKIDEFTPEIGAPQEGIATLKSARVIADKNGIEIPFIDALYSIIFEGMSIKEGLNKIK